MINEREFASERETPCQFDGLIILIEGAITVGLKDLIRFNMRWMRMNLY
jgi:hypothetical protein